MPSLLLKNLPDDLHQAIKERAARNRRSMNQEVLSCLELVLSGLTVQPETETSEMQKLRRLASGFLDEEFLHRAKNDGRP